jgi:peptidoglycan hydrolase-like protein with peptidoglycan-binding domain
MKNSVLLLAVVFLVTSFIGCGKKKDETASMEGLNGVISENVISVTDTGAEGVAVVVDNAENAAALPAGEMAAVAEAEPLAKPTAKQIQQALKNAGFYNGKVDGDIGPRTKKAIEAFQSANNLKADGKVGARTWKALSVHLNGSAEVQNPSAEAQAFGQQP